MYTLNPVLKFAIAEYKSQRAAQKRFKKTKMANPPDDVTCPEEVFPQSIESVFVISLSFLFLFPFLFHVKTKKEVNRMEENKIKFPSLKKEMFLEKIQKNTNPQPLPSKDLAGSKSLL